MLDQLLEPLNLVAVLAIGLCAGVLGGLVGVGGSTIMIPGLTFLFGYDQHLYQAAAMIANIAVSVPAALKHRRAGALNPKALVWMLPAALVFVMVGVWVSNWEVFEGEEGGKWLGRLLAAFLLYVIFVNVQRLTGKAAAHEATVTPRITPGRSIFAGSFMGGFAGLLGIGGGAVAVPMQQVLLRMPLKQAIANSSAVICISAGVGSIYKNASLGQHGDSPWHGVALALLLAPTCWIGGHLGAVLMHRLPTRQVRVAFVVLMVIAAWKMAAIDWP